MRNSRLSNEVQNSMNLFKAETWQEKQTPRETRRTRQTRAN